MLLVILDFRSLWKLDVDEPGSLHNVFATRDRGVDKQCLPTDLKRILVVSTMASLSASTLPQSF